jgi:hypothetical protein
MALFKIKLKGPVQNKTKKTGTSVPAHREHVLLLDGFGGGG